MVRAALHLGIISRPRERFKRMFGDMVARIMYLPGGIFLVALGD